MADISKTEKEEGILFGITILLILGAFLIMNDNKWGWFPLLLGVIGECRYFRIRKKIALEKNKLTPIPMIFIGIGAFFIVFKQALPLFFLGTICELFYSRTRYKIAQKFKKIPLYPIIFVCLGLFWLSLSVVEQFKEPSEYSIFFVTFPGVILALFGLFGEWLYKDIRTNIAQENNKLPRAPIMLLLLILLVILFSIAFAIVGGFFILKQVFTFLSNGIWQSYSCIDLILSFDFFPVATKEWAADPKNLIGLNKILRFLNASVFFIVLSAACIFGNYSIYKKYRDEYDIEFASEFIVFQRKG